MLSPSLAVTWVPPARDQPTGSASEACDLTLPVVVVSRWCGAGWASFTRGLESAEAIDVPATGASADLLTGFGERSTGVTAPRAIDPVCEPSTAAAGTVSPGYGWLGAMIWRWLAVAPVNMPSVP